MMPIDRRQVLTGMTTAFLVGFLGSPRALADAREQTRIIGQSAVAPAKAAPPLDFDLFYDLSRYVTARSGLDRRTARLHHEAFRNEQWSWANAARLYAAIRDAVASDMASAPELMLSGRLDRVDQWFAEHLLETWYTGWYHFEGVSRRLTYEHALMWQVVDDFMPIQGLSDAEYGSWARQPPPEGR